MLESMGVLIGCAWIGDVLSRRLHLPLPGAVTGMLVLIAGLSLNLRRKAPEAPQAALRGSALARTSTTLVGIMGVLFVPAGVGVIAEVDLMRRDALPILAAVVASSVASLLVSGWIMQWALRRLANGEESA